MPIQRDRRLQARVGQLLLQCVMLKDDLAVFEERLVGRVNDDRAIIAIEQSVLAAFELAADVLQSYDCWNPQRARHDCGMRRLAANIDGETKDVPLVQLGGVRGSQIMADDDAGIFEMAQVDLRFEAEQIVQHTSRDVAHVVGSLAQVIVFDASESARVTLSHAVKCVLGINLVLLDHTQYFIQQGSILEDQKMGIKDAGFLGAHAFDDLLLDLLDLLARFNDSLFEPVDFFGEFSVGNASFVYRGTRAANHQNFAAADA